MRIAFISSMKGAVWGGSEELWAAAAERALKRGHEVAVSVFDWPEPAAKVRILRERGARMLLRDVKRSRLKGLVSRPAWIRGLEAFAPEAVCLSQGSAYECAGRRSTRALFPFLRRSGVPVVNVVQFNQEREALRPAVAARARWLFENAAANAFVARVNIAQAERTLGVTVPRASVVCNPVNLKDASPLDWPRAAGPARLACVARLEDKTKNQGTLLRVLAQPEWCGRDWRLSLYGQGGNRSMLEALAQEVGIAERVEFRGHSGDLRAVWAEHHALVLPSRAEGTPLAMVEAMLLGRVCVVTDVGGCGDWVRDGVDGFVASGPGQTELGAALERAWAERPRWHELGASGRARPAELHEPDAGGRLLQMIEGAAGLPGVP